MPPATSWESCWANIKNKPDKLPLHNVTNRFLYALQLVQFAARKMSLQNMKGVDIPKAIRVEFKKQFKEGEITKFKPYSKYPPCYKDISFWIPDDFEPNDFFELGRGVAGELVETVELIDEFTNPKKGKTSHCYRVTYRSMDRSLTDEEINGLQESLRERAAEERKVELR